MPLKTIHIKKYVISSPYLIFNPHLKYIKYLPDVLSLTQHENLK